MQQYIHEETRITRPVHVRFETYCDSNHFITKHWHNSLEVLYIYEGCLQVVINDTLHILNPGDFIAINSKDIHSTYSADSVKVLLLQIPSSLLKSSIPDFEYIRFETSHIPKATSALQEESSPVAILLAMEEVYEAKKEGFSIRFTGLLYDFLYCLYTHYKVSISLAVKSKSDKNHKRLELIMGYVHDHYTDTISLEEIADLVALNEEYFCRFFKRFMGLTFLDYVNSVRLSHVYEDLVQTDLTITQILGLHGFTNYKLFMKLFKDTYGCTPKQKRLALSKAL